MRRLYIVTSFVVLLLVSFLGITYSYEYDNNTVITFELLGDYSLDLDLGESYVEYGVRVYYDGKDVSSMGNIDDSMLNINKVGTYKIKYEINIDNVSEYVYRTVNIKENISPQIILNGDNIIYVRHNGTYVEPGYEVNDNYDSDVYLRSKMVITNNVDVTKVGEYLVKYSVFDSSGNQTVVFRKVIVK